MTDEMLEAEGQAPNSWYEMVVTPPPGAFGSARRAAFIGGLGLILLALNLYAPAHPLWSERVLGSAALVVAALPTWLWLGGSDRNVPFVPFLGLIFSVYFTVPLFLVNDYNTYWSSAGVDHELVARALGLILIGLCCTMLGYYGPQGDLLERVLPRARMDWSRLGFVKLSGIAFAVAGFGILMFAHASTTAQALQELIVFAADLCVIGMCILYALQLVGRLDRFTTIFLWCALVPLRVWLGLGSGLASQGLLVVLTLMMVYATIRHRMPWVVILLAAVAFMVIRPVESEYRMATWEGGYFQGASEFEKGMLLSGLVMRNVKQMFAGETGAYDLTMDLASRRLCVDLITLADVIHDTGRTVPYWTGASYRPLLYKFVPRFIYPDKPVEDTGQTFGHRYGLLNPANYDTSYNLPQLTELYVNFGLPGVIVGMFLFGLLYRAMRAILVHPAMGFGALIGAIYLSIEMLAVESATSMMIGELIWGFIYLGLLSAFIQSGELEHRTVVPAKASMP
jgi:hypothetical protein